MVVLHLLAALAVVCNSLPIGWRVALLAALAAHFGWFQNVEWRHPAISGLSWRADGSWELLSREGSRDAVIDGTPVLTRWLVILPLRSDRRLRHVLVCRDSVDPESFRRLRVQLAVWGAKDDG